LIDWIKFLREEVSIWSGKRRKHNEEKKGNKRKKGENISAPDF